jgi:AGZA family xanthine/uracil permease-like MFS transporter
LILATVTVLIIERRLLAAAGWALAAAALSLLGLMHSWRFTTSDTVSAIPLLDRLTQVSHGDGSLFPAATYAVGYAGIALALVLARWFTEPEKD